MSDIKHRQLGHHGPAVSSIGLGCMSLSGTYGEADDGQSMSLIHHAIDMGINHLDSSDMYGWGHNESVVGAALKGRPEHVRAACDASLKRLGVDVIDLYYQHRVDPDVAVEETVGAMADLVAAGKVRFLGMSEASPERVRKAHAVHPISVSAP